MDNPIIRRDIGSRCTLLHKIVRNETEITFQLRYLFPLEKRDFHKMNGILRNIRLDCRGDILKALTQGFGTAPRFQSVVKHQSYDGIVRRQRLFLPRLALPLAYLLAVVGPVVTKQPQRHPGVGTGLVFRPADQNGDIFPFPAFQDIPFLFVNAVCHFQIAHCGGILQFLRLHQIRAAKQKDVHNLRENLVYVQQDFLRDVLIFGHERLLALGIEFLFIRPSL